MNQVCANTFEYIQLFCFGVFFVNKKRELCERKLMEN